MISGCLGHLEVILPLQSTHKSYPSKMSSAEEFHTDGLKARAAKKDDVIGSLRDVVVPSESLIHPDVIIHWRGGSYVGLSAEGCVRLRV